MNDGHDEFGSLRDRVAQIEARHELLSYRLAVVEKPDAEPSRSSGQTGFTLKEIVTWLIIGAMFLGQGPQAIEIAKVLLK